MSEQMSIERYLAAGGVLTSPDNATPRYRAELMKLMATFVDSELAGAAGFADIINQAPGIKERIAAAKIVLEKNDHAFRVLKLMGEFGANTEQYATHHPWTARLDRTADIGATRSDHDMRLAVFNYPLEGWTDAVTMNLLMGRAVTVQLAELQMVSYQPLAEQFRSIAPREARHAELAEEGLRSLLSDGETRTAVQAAIDYWWPRVGASFGTSESSKFEFLKTFGLRKTPNVELRTRWEAEAQSILEELGLKHP